MANGRTVYLDRALQEVLAAAADTPQTLEFQAVCARAIERVVRQCHSWLRQESERRASREPGLYGRDRMEQVLQRFEATMPNIQDTIATQVVGSIAELIRQELRRILQDALSDLEDAMTKTTSRVMVVEDAPEFQGAVVLSLLLEPYFKNVHIAASGEEALEAFAQFSPKLVLLDFRLPGIDGLETAKRMKEQRPDVKIVLVTAYAEDVLKQAAREANVEEVIPKADFSLARLRQLLDRDS